MKRRNATERRAKLRFPVSREMRYKLLENGKIIATGHGETTDMSSGGIAFRTNAMAEAGDYLELSISWPALLDDTCPMRLVVYGRLVRRSESLVVCSVEKWEFRTGSRQLQQVVPMQPDNRLLRWVEYRRDVLMKTAATASAMA
jgi:PilZ domain-containing protein